MADIQKPDMSKQWANSGNKTPPADSLINSGWIAGQIPLESDFNYIDARQDQGLAYLLQKGIPEWDGSTEYRANKSYVQYNGKIYKCIQTGTNKQPDTHLTYWRDEQGISPSRTIASFDGTGIADGSLIYFSGRDSIGDGGEGHLRFLAGSTVTADGGTVYAVPGGRLVREGWTVFGVQPEWFGGTDSAAINLAAAALRAKGAGRVLFSPGKRYAITDQVVIPSGITLKGGDQIISTEYTVADPKYYNLPQFDITVTGKPAFLLNTSSGMIGFSFFYPNQVTETESTPVVYDWTIATNVAFSGNIDNIVLENLLLVNSYKGISLDKAGRFTLRNIYGQPFYRGLFIDRVYDKARMHDVHFWTFYATLASNLGNWIKNNGVAFDINRADGLSASGGLALGYKEGLSFNDVGNGGCWGDFTSFDVDGNLWPFVFNKVQKVSIIGGSGTTLDSVYPVVWTGADIGGQVSFNATKIYGISNIGAVINSATGSVDFNGAIFPSKVNNGPDGVAIVNQGGCRVAVNSCLLGGNKVYGGANTTINGVPLLTSNNLIALTNNPSLSASWSGALSTTEVTNGIRFNVTSAFDFADYTFGNEVRAPGLYVLEADIECPANSGMSVYIHICDSSGSSNPVVVYASATGVQNYDRVAGNGSSKTHLVFPYYHGSLSEQPRLRVELHTYATGVTTTLALKNLKFYKPDPANILNSSAQLIQGNMFAEPVFSSNVSRNRYPSLSLLNTSGAPSYDGTPQGNQVLYGIEAPTLGTWRMGDRVVNCRPAVGQPKGWVCTVGGSPGTWVSEGNL